MQSLDGKVRKVRASHYVLACGAIENSRLLLASNDVEPHGVGNRTDQVGRCFMTRHCSSSLKVGMAAATRAQHLAFDRFG